MSLVTRAQAKDQLRVTISADDAQIDQIIDRASAILLDYIGQEVDAWQQTDGNSPTEDVPKVVEAACLILVQNLYDGIDPVLTPSVKDLLRRYRTPTVL